MARSFRQIIELWEHKTSFAQDVGVPYERAKAWWSRNRIPGRYFVAVARAAQSRGHTDVTEQVLSAIAAKPVIPHQEKVAA